MSNARLGRMPKEGEYFTGEDVDINTLPLFFPKSELDKHNTKLQPSVRSSEPCNCTLCQATRIGQLPLLLRFFLCSSLKRAENRRSMRLTFDLKVDGQAFPNKHLIICSETFFIGGIGGIVTGIQTGFFSTNRLPVPNVPVPIRLQQVQKAAQYSMQHSSAVYRIGKRVLVSGYIFDLIEKNVEEVCDLSDPQRGKEGWSNMGISGAITGGMFGLRGGLHGAARGSMVFSIFASASGILYDFTRNLSF